MENTENSFSEQILNKFKSLRTTLINQRYSWGKYEDFNIIICLKTGYVNGSVLMEEVLNYETISRKTSDKKNCSQRKQMLDWILNDRTLSILESAAIKLNINKIDLMFENKGKQKRGEELLGGTFIHPFFINFIIEWISPAFAVKKTNIISKIDLTGFKSIFNQMNETIINQKKMLEENEKLIINNNQIIERIDNIKEKIQNMCN